MIIFCVGIDIDKIKVGNGMHVFFSWDLNAHLAFLQHKKRCSVDILRLTDNSSLV